MKKEQTKVSNVVLANEKRETVETMEMKKQRMKKMKNRREGKE